MFKFEKSFLLGNETFLKQALQSFCKTLFVSLSIDIGYSHSYFCVDSFIQIVAISIFSIICDINWVSEKQ